jgi:hypothetical protein
VFDGGDADRCGCDSPVSKKQVRDAWRIQPSSLRSGNWRRWSFRISVGHGHGVITHTIPRDSREKEKPTAKCCSKTEGVQPFQAHPKKIRRRVSHPRQLKT